MFRKLLGCAIALSSLAPCALVACAGGGDLSDGAEVGDQQDLTAGSPRPALVGSYVDRNQLSQDFGSLELNADGRYTAHVLTSVAKTKVLCNHAPCNVGEAGSWSVSTAPNGVDRLRIKPDDDAVRVYVLSTDTIKCFVAPCPKGTSIRLDRGASSQILDRVTSPTTSSPAAPAPGPAPKATCASLGGQCRHSPTDITFPANCGADFGTTTLDGKCEATTEVCCSFTTHEPPHEVTCESLGGECRHSPTDVTFPALCKQDFGAETLSGKCAAFTEACCSKVIHAPKCATIRCLPDTHCVEKADGTAACEK